MSFFLADSIVTRGYRDLLFRQLEDWQAAPPGFLVFARSSLLLFGWFPANARCACHRCWLVWHHFRCFSRWSGERLHRAAD